MRRARWLLPIFLAIAALDAQAHEVRILLVGDSWAAGFLGFQAFEKALLQFDRDALVSGATTAIGGSRADQWASNHEGKRDALQAALENPVDLVVLCLGGNDLLRAAQDGAIADERQRLRLCLQVTHNLGLLLDTIRNDAPDAAILLIGYDYLDPKRMQAVFGLEFPPESIQHLDTALEELEKARAALADERHRVQFVSNLGLLRDAYGIEAPNALPDGAHPTPEAYQLIAVRAWKAAAPLIALEQAG